MTQMKAAPALDLLDERIRRGEGAKAVLGTLAERVRAGDLGVLPIVVGLVVIWTVFQILNPVFLSSANLVNLLMESVSVGIIALGVVCVLLVGQIDLSVGSVSGLSAALTAVTFVDAGWPFWASILAAIAAGGAIGWVYAQMVTRLGVPSFVATLAGLLGFLGLQLWLLGSKGAINLPRKRVATLLGAERPERIVFTFNGTDSLNLALHGVLRAGDHVVTSVLEHNSVARPLRWMEPRLNLSVTRLIPDGSGTIDPASVRKALRPETRLVVLTHASNVTGAVQPIDDVGQIAREAGVMFLVDAAQTAGAWPIDVSRTPVDLLACPGHKGLLGPLGTGLLYMRPGVETHVNSLRQGGTGTSSESDCEPDSMPEKYEPGNHNAPGLAGLEAGLAWLSERTVTSVQAHERELTARLLAGLRGVPGVTVHGPDENGPRVGVVSVTVENFDPHDVAAILDERFRIQVRAGLHCAPGAHGSLGTLASGGTVRLSVGPFTTADDIAAALAAFEEIAAA